MKTNRKGFTLVEIMIVVAIIALLAAIAIPSFLKSRLQARTSSCINTLRLIDHAKEQWATTNNKNTGDAVGLTDVQPYLKGTAMPHCPNSPSGTTPDYVPNPIGTDPACPNVAIAGSTDHVLPH
jgi:prepilin-type N-terminal cleavage/methylation domain-containing protein